MVHAYTFRLFDYPLSPIHINGERNQKKKKIINKTKSYETFIYACLSFIKREISQFPAVYKFQAVQTKNEQ